MVVPFAMLLNLASVAGAKDAKGLWGFIKRYAPEASPETHPDLDAAAAHALRYFADKIAPTRVFRLPSDKERAAIADLRARLVAVEGATDDESLQNICYAVGKDHGFEPLRDWFKALYEAVSYTHLDVYKRQGPPTSPPRRWGWPPLGRAPCAVRPAR